MVEISLTDNAYSGTEPFPFYVVDNLLPPEVFAEATAGLLPNTDPAWVHYDNPLEVKSALNDRSKFPLVISSLLEALYSDEMCSLLPTLLGLRCERVYPDPLMLGAGIHSIGRNGKLDLHLDHNRNSKHPGMERKVNAIYWFHPEWKDSWGGDLELWHAKDGKPTELGVAIRPQPNRLAIFKACDVSFHGHPAPITCPDGTFRTSLALYYYSDVLEDSYVREKVKFVGLPGETPSDELESLRAARSDPQRAADVWRLGVKQA